MADGRHRIPRAKLGTQGLEVSKLGFGCMGLTGVYNDPVPEEVGLSIIADAFAKGITFFDTSDVYGPKVNEILVGKALKKLPRKEVQLATKFGVGTWDRHCSLQSSRQRFFGGKGSNSFLERHLPRYQPENLEKNKIFRARIEKLAEKHGCAPAQLALAWVFHQGGDVVPIPGTTKTENLDKNIGSLRVKFTENDLKEISGVIPIDEVAGSRINEHYARYSWKNANTPPRDRNFSA